MTEEGLIRLDFTTPCSVEQQCAETQKLVEYFYGPHESEYESDFCLDFMPFALREFYRLNAFRPGIVDSSVPFYLEDSTQPHLLPLEDLMVNSGQMKFLVERNAGIGQPQKNWFAWSETDGRDPWVWLKGTMFAEDSSAYRETRIKQPLSEFLFSHLLFFCLYGYSSCYEGEWTRGDQAESSVEREMKLIWNTDNSYCSFCAYMNGKYFLFKNKVLIHETDNGRYCWGSPRVSLNSLAGK